jgi:hypothetical protein
MEPEGSLPRSQGPGHWSPFRARWIQSTPFHPVSKILSNIILPSTPRSSEWSLPFMFSDEDFVLISHSSRACYVPQPSHPPWFGHRNNIWWSLQVMKLLILQSSPASRHFLPLRSRYSPQHLFSNTLNLLCSSLNVHYHPPPPSRTVCFLVPSARRSRCSLGCTGPRQMADPLTHLHGHFTKRTCVITLLVVVPALDIAVVAKPSVNFRARNNHDQVIARVQPLQPSAWRH